ncbi:MAG: hypothetical protein F4Y41_02750 [Gammaproteobacteria bacterium]|nr:hypothetical protein [Gammaproteobacteria bacterium]MYF27812.1 hypothetical protein [Gammaproteobacteria bacterium]
MKDDSAAPYVRGGEWVWVDPDEPAEPGRLVAAWADAAESVTIVRLMVVDGELRVLRAPDGGLPDIAVTRDNETMIRGVVVFVGRSV